MNAPTPSFRNVQSQGRSSRGVRGDKHAFEKQRLADRREGFQRHDPDKNPIRVQQDALGFLNDNERFHTDTAGEEKVRRDNVLARKQKLIDVKRESNTNKEEQKKRQVENEHRKELEKLETKRNAEMVRKNNSSVRYDLISMDSKNEKDRLSEKYKRDMAHHSGAIRATRLFQKDSSVGYNLLTGESRVSSTYIPDRPTTRPQL